MDAAMPRCERTWIQTFTGKQFWPLNPRAEDVDIVDIAHALANTCRYSGHCRSFYSVAQHCLIMCDQSPFEFKAQALMHDAAEAYIADLARPVKRAIPKYKEIESRLEECIAERFSLSFPWANFIHDLDLRALATERRDLMATPPIPWLSIEGVEPFHDRIIPMAPEVARQRFLDRAFCLGIR